MARPNGLVVNGDRTVAADHDGDGKADLTVFRPSSGVWYILRCYTSSLLARQGGQAGDLPIVGFTAGRFTNCEGRMAIWRSRQITMVTAKPIWRSFGRQTVTGTFCVVPTALLLACTGGKMGIFRSPGSRLGNPKKTNLPGRSCTDRVCANFLSR